MRSFKDFVVPVDCVKIPGTIYMLDAAGQSKILQITQEAEKLLRAATSHVSGKTGFETRAFMGWVEWSPNRNLVEFEKINGLMIVDGTICTTEV